MEIKLKKLILQNFKGIKNLEIDFSQETNIYGQNATGKTTIFDAYLWLLFDKDSSNATQFNIKTLDKDGQPIHQLEHSVEGHFKIDGQSVELKKVYKEKWTKKRGSQESVFDGHTTDYFINGVPSKQKEYKSYVDRIIDEERFKLISNPRYFSVDLDKNKRRAILMSMASIDSSEIIKLNDELKELDLEKHSIEDLEKMNKATAKRINEQLKELPIRIDELRESIEEIDFDALEFQKKSVTGSLNHLDEEIAKGDNTETLKEISAEINKLMLEQFEIGQATDKANMELEFEVTKHNSEADKANRLKKELIESTEKKILKLGGELVRRSDDLEKFRKEYIELSKKQYEGDCICPTCGQDLPADEVEQLIKKFNLEKSEKLSRMETEGKRDKEKFEQLQLEVTKEKEILKNALEQEIVLERKFVKAPYPKEYEDFTVKIEQLRQKQKNLNSGDVDNLILKKKELTAKLDDINSKLAYKDINEKSKAKIDEYRAKMKEYSKQYDEVQKVLYLCDLYKKTEVELVNKSISDKFQIVEWRMYENLINGGIVETCEALINGVPYSDANNAAKINAGIDIINTLSKEYDTRAPIFVDNAESVNELIKTDSQIVRLVVSDDKELRVEI